MKQNMVGYDACESFPVLAFNAVMHARQTSHTDEKQLQSCGFPIQISTQFSHLLPPFFFLIFFCKGLVVVLKCTFLLTVAASCLQTLTRHSTQQTALASRGGK